MEAEAAHATATDLEHQLGELAAATRVTREDAARLKALASEIACEEQGLADLRLKSDGLSRRAEALQQQIDGAGGEKLRQQRSLCEKLREVKGLPGMLCASCALLLGVRSVLCDCRTSQPAKVRRPRRVSRLAPRSSSWTDWPRRLASQRRNATS